MKKLTLLICILILTSCGYDTPIIGLKESPFIVEEIEEFGYSFCKYKTSTNNGSQDYSVLLSWGAAVILPKGMYNVGDTIDFTKNINNLK